MATIKPDAVADPRPGSRGYLKWYWTKGPGLAKWVASPTPYRALKAHLIKYVPATYVDKVVAQWFHDAKGYWPAERNGKNPVGPG
ncbi:hypothetical protein ACFJGV_15100 [Cnuibacter sp. UC19_7]|uniref:hypothetical protein n=1 Tax=Cnuibacter sp. UC19_7 TaxID=3350166 RepID=UPI0036707647